MTDSATPNWIGLAHTGSAGVISSWYDGAGSATPLQFKTSDTLRATITTGGTFQQPIPNGNDGLFHQVPSNSYTGYIYSHVVNNGGSYYLGLERVSGSGLCNNATSYSTVLTTNNATPLTFGTNGVARLSITSAGELCLNTTSALGSGLFSLQGLTSAFNLIAIKDTGTSYSSTNNNFIYFMQSTGGTCGSISHASATTVNYYTGPSDQRKKENIEDWSQEVLPLFEDIKPKTYNHIEDYDSSYIYKGYMAQDMVDKFPEAYGQDKEGFYTFNPSGYIPYLVKAIQEQIKINKYQQTQIEELKAKIK